MSSITTTNQKQFRISTQGTFSKGFSGKYIGDFTELHNEKNKNNQEVKCKQNRLGYWNSYKRLPNFVNVAALPQTAGSAGQVKIWMISNVS